MFSYISSFLHEREHIVNTALHSTFFTYWYNLDFTPYQLSSVLQMKR